MWGRKEKGGVGVGGKGGGWRRRKCRGEGGGEGRKGVGEKVGGCEGRREEVLGSGGEGGMGNGEGSVGNGGGIGRRRRNGTRKEVK